MAYGALTANGHTSEDNGVGKGIVTGHLIDVVLAGTFTATCQIQALGPGGTWVPLGANITANNAQMLQFASEKRVRVAVTAFTSGTINYEINGSRSRDRMV